MTYDDAKATPLDERDVTRPGHSRPVHQCADCGSTVSPQFVRRGEDMLCQACWRICDDRRNSVPESYGDEAA